MADFIPAFEKTMTYEGGFVLHEVKGDRGGLTFAGIAENFHPDWLGWPIIKQHGAEDMRLTPLVKEFYKSKFWDLMKGDEICDQEIAENIFDFGVNAGMGTSAKIAQTIAGVTPDGGIGPVSVRALNQLNGDDFSAAMFILKVDRYSRIVNRNPSQAKFLRGWVNRSLKILKS